MRELGRGHADDDELRVDARSSAGTPRAPGAGGCCRPRSRCRCRRRTCRPSSLFSVAYTIGSAQSVPRHRHRVDHPQGVVEPLPRRDRERLQRRVVPLRDRSSVVKPTAVADGSVASCTSASAADASRAVIGMPGDRRAHRAGHVHAPAGCACPDGSHRAEGRVERRVERVGHLPRRRPLAGATRRPARGVGPLRDQHVDRVHPRLARSRSASVSCATTSSVRPPRSGSMPEPGEPRQLTHQRRLRHADVEQRVPHRRPRRAPGRAASPTRAGTRARARDHASSASVAAWALHEALDQAPACARRREPRTIQSKMSFSSARVGAAGAPAAAGRGATSPRAGGT